MSKIVTCFSTVFVCLIAFSASVSAQTIEARNVKHREVSYDSSEPWYEIEIELDAIRAGVNESRRDDDFVDDVTVELLLGFEMKSRNREMPFEFYTGSVELASVEKGRNWVRFYLPPEIVERDRLRGSPHSYLVRLTQGGEVQFVLYSPSLERESVRENFEKRVMEGNERNKGILVHQSKTPFISEYSDSTASVKVD